MILSDRSIREALAAGRIEIDPLDESCIQPSSVDLHLDRYFRVFLNHTMRVIDVKEDQEELTQLVEIVEDEPFVLHPGEFVLGSTIERVKLPPDLVARLEGKSSLGRLGLLIHSSLPAGEEVLLLHDGHLQPRPIEEIVRKRLEGEVVSFDPDTLETVYAPITGWYEGPPDRIFEIRLASGRRVRVTAGHNLFTFDRHGNVTKTRTLELGPGTPVAIPRTIPDPPLGAPVLDLRRVVPECGDENLVVEGPTIAAAFDDPRVRALRRDAGYDTGSSRSRAALPAGLARQVPGLFERLGPGDRLRVGGTACWLPVVMPVDPPLAWLLGVTVAAGDHRGGQVVVAHADADVLARARAGFARLGQPVSGRAGAVTCSSSLFADLVEWIGAGGAAQVRRIPPLVHGWPRHLLDAFLEGLVDGDGSRAAESHRVRTPSPGLAADVLLLAARLGRPACHRAGRQERHEVVLAGAGHTPAVPAQLTEAFERGEIPVAARRRLVEGGMVWDEVVEVVDTGEAETIFDLEVRPGRRHVENFVAGAGGVFVSNTAGFVDAGWDGQLTLELSNVANLPITLYAGMKIGQISFLQMTTEADNPYGSTQVGSKYQHQVGPRPSRYFENFRQP